MKAWRILFLVFFLSTIYLPSSSDVFALCDDISLSGSLEKVVRVPGVGFTVDIKWNGHQYLGFSNTSFDIVAEVKIHGRGTVYTSAPITVPGGTTFKSITVPGLVTENMEAESATARITMKASGTLKFLSCDGYAGTTVGCQEDYREYVSNITIGTPDRKVTGGTKVPITWKTEDPKRCNQEFKDFKVTAEIGLSRVFGTFDQKGEKLVAGTLRETTVDTTGIPGGVIYSVLVKLEPTMTVSHTMTLTKTFPLPPSIR